MNHLFKQLYSKREIPEELEKEILNSFDTLKMIGEITSLFTEKFGRAEYEFHAGLEASLRESEKHVTSDDEDPEE